MLKSRWREMSFNFFSRYEYKCKLLRNELFREQVLNLWPAFGLCAACLHFYDVPWYEKACFGIMLSVFCSNCCYEKLLSLVTNVKWRMRTRLADGHLEGRMWIAWEVKLDIRDITQANVVWTMSLMADSVKGNWRVMCEPTCDSVLVAL
jgi:hypothetical protein